MIALATASCYYLERRTHEKSQILLCCTFAIHFHFSEVFADFLHILNCVDDCFEDILFRINFVNGKFCDILRKLNFAKICQICKI